MLTYFDVILPDAPGMPATEFTLYYVEDEEWKYHAILSVDMGFERFVTSFTVTVNQTKTYLMDKAHAEAIKWVRENLDIMVKV